MARKAYGLHATQVNLSSYPDDGTSPVGSAEWNEALDNEGMLGFTPQTSTVTLSSNALLVTDTVTVVAGESGAADDIDTITLTNTSEYDLLYLFGQSSYNVTLKHTSSLSSNGQIQTVSGSDEILSATSPTILIRKGNYWYGYGGGVVNAVSDIGDVTISSIGSGELLKWNGSAWINQTLAEAGIQATITTGIADDNIAEIDDSDAADNDYAKFTANGLEGRSYAEVLSDIGAQAALTFGISNTNVTKCGAAVADNDFVKVDGTTFEGRTAAEVLSDIAALGLAGGTMTGAINMGGQDITNGGVVFLTEQADAETDVAGKGQIWVDTATPNKLMFTDDAGTDFDLTAGGGDPTDDVNYSGTYDIEDLQRASFEIQLNNFDESAQTASGQINADITGESQVYVKVIDSNNDGVFARLKKNGSIVNVQLA